MASANATGPGPSGVAGSSNHSTWGCQMDALVTDLSLALDESQQLQRRRRPFRRRAANQQGQPEKPAFFRFHLFKSVNYTNLYNLWFAMFKNSHLILG